jgi:predicted nucleic acid-binding Zn ribbon protein
VTFFVSFVFFVGVPLSNEEELTKNGHRRSCHCQHPWQQRPNLPSLPGASVPEANRTSQLDAALDSARTPGIPRSCPVCGVPLTGRQRTACSGRCRRELSRLRDAATTEAKVATLQHRVVDLQAETHVLRQHVVELTDRLAERDAENAALHQRVAEWGAKFMNLKKQRQVRPR